MVRDFFTWPLAVKYPFGAFFRSEGMATLWISNEEKTAFFNKKKSLQIPSDDDGGQAGREGPLPVLAARRRRQGRRGGVLRGGPGMLSLNKGGGARQLKGGPGKQVCQQTKNNIE